MREIDGDLVFGEVDHSNLTHATAKLAGELAVEGLHSSEDPWIASMDVTPVPVALTEGGFGVDLQTTTAYDAETLSDMAGSACCRGLTVHTAGHTAMHPSVEGVVASLRAGAMAQSAR